MMRLLFCSKLQKFVSKLIFNFYLIFCIFGHKFFKMKRASQILIHTGMINGEPAGRQAAAVTAKK